MTPDEAADRIEQFARDLPEAVRKGAEDVARLARERAIWWSSGPYSTAALRRMYNPRGPYSRVDPNPPGAGAGRINIQTGNLVAGWRTDPPTRVGSKVQVSVYNTTPEAGYMGHWQGEEFVQGPRSRMMARPLPVKVLEELERSEAVMERLQAAIGEAMR